MPMPSGLVLKNGSNSVRAHERREAGVQCREPAHFARAVLLRAQGKYARAIAARAHGFERIDRKVQDEMLQ